MYSYVEWCRIIRMLEGWNEIHAAACILELERINPVLKMMLIKKLEERIQIIL